MITLLENKPLMATLLPDGAKAKCHLESGDGVCI